MPLNVSDSHGNHLGFVAKSYPEAPGILMVALTELKVEDFEMELDRLRAYLAGVYGAKSWRGKIDHDKLYTELTAEYSGVRYRDEEELLRYAFMKTVLDRDELIEFRDLYVDVREDSAKGFILLSLRNAVWEGTRIVLNEVVDYLPDDKTLGSLPVYARVIGYPTFRTDIMGIGGFLLGANMADLGGRNHIHTTILQIVSGNVKKTIELPVHIHVAKGMDIQLSLAEDKVERVFCGGAIYSWGHD